MNTAPKNTLSTIQYEKDAKESLISHNECENSTSHYPLINKILIALLTIAIVILILTLKIESPAINYLFVIGIIVNLLGLIIGIIITYLHDDKEKAKILLLIYSNAILLFLYSFRVAYYISSKMVYFSIPIDFG